MGVENFPVESDGEADTGARRAKRNRVLLAARIKTAEGEIDVRLRDLSQRGALVECGALLTQDQEVVFTRGSTIVPARVAWTGGNRVGLEFLRSIDESEVLVQLRRAPGSQPPPQRFRRPRINGLDLTDQERRLAQVWGKSVGISFQD